MKKYFQWKMKQAEKIGEKEIFSVFFREKPALLLINLKEALYVMDHYDFYNQN